MKIVVKLMDAVKTNNAVNQAIVVWKEQFVSAKIVLLFKNNNLVVAFIVKNVIKMLHAVLKKNAVIRGIVVNLEKYVNVKIVLHLDNKLSRIIDKK